MLNLLLILNGMKVELKRCANATTAPLDVTPDFPQKINRLRDMMLSSNHQYNYNESYFVK